MRMQRSTGWAGSCGDGRVSDSGIRRSDAHWLRTGGTEQTGVVAGDSLAASVSKQQAFTEETVTRRATDSTALQHETRRQQQTEERVERRARYR